MRLSSDGRPQLPGNSVCFQTERIPEVTAPPDARMDVVSNHGVSKRESGWDRSRPGNLRLTSVGKQSSNDCARRERAKGTRKPGQKHLARASDTCGLVSRVRDEHRRREQGRQKLFEDSNTWGRYISPD